MSEEKAEYNIEEIKKDQAALNKYAAIKNASEDTIGVSRVYLEMMEYDFAAALILDELMFWTLPQKRTGKTGLRVRRNGYYWLAVARAEWLTRKGLPERQADRGIDKLEKMGIIIKDNFYFDGKPRIHLRVVPAKFFEIYGQAMAKKYHDEETQETAEKELSDLYEMMGLSNLPNGNLPNGDSNLPNGNSINLPNGNIINSPNNPDSTLPATVSKSFVEKSLEWRIAAGLPITQADLDQTATQKTATDSFERELVFPPLPWSSNAAWEKLEKFVAKVYTADPQVFADFSAWREGAGKFKGWNNSKIRDHPQYFESALAEFRKDIPAASGDAVTLDQFGMPETY